MSSSSNQSGSSDALSERETQFVYQPGDEDVLWAVQEITAERDDRYKVKWVGIDPDTGKPWPQSWVAKHDCTDDLVVVWKKKKRLAAGKNTKRGRQTNTTSRTSGASNHAGSSTSGAMTRRSTSKATSSRLGAIEQHVFPPPKQTATKRKRQSETPATTTSGAVQADEQGKSSRPHKKQKTIIEVLLPPVSSGEDSDKVLAPNVHAKGTLQNKVPRKGSGPSRDVSDGDDGSPPRAKVKSGHRSDARSKGTIVGARAFEVRAPPTKTETKVVPRRKKRATNAVVLSDECENEDEDEDLRPPRSKEKSLAKRKSPSEQKDDLSEKEAELTVHPIKIGPPRGVKRQQTSRKFGSSSKPGPSRTKPRKDDPADECVPVQESTRHFDHKVPSFGSPSLINSRASPPRHIVVPQVPPITRAHSPDLSPWAKERLELFDRMLAQPDIAPAPPNVSEHVADDFDVNGTHDTRDAIDIFVPPPVGPSPSKSKAEDLKLGTPNGLIVPETESSGNSQTQSQLLPRPPPPPQPPLARKSITRKPINLPTIAVITASATSSSTSPQDLVPSQKLPPPTNRPPKKPTFMITPSSYRSTTNARRHVTDEPPPSSIESFPSPGRLDKGKHKAIEDHQLQSSPSHEQEDGRRRKSRPQKKITDSELKKRGKELFDQAQLAREAEWQRNKKPKKQLKTVNEIVNGAVASSSKGSPLLIPSGVESALELRLEDVMDLGESANSATLDTPEHSEAKPLSEEERERLRFELRQEEEENTQEAMGVYPLPLVEESKVIHDEDSQMPPPRSPKNSSVSGHAEDVDRIEQPSTDLLQASVIVQASQERRHEDTDIEPLLAKQSTSSPPRPIPENLTDSPKRRLGEALSLLNVKSEEIQRLERELANERKILQGSKAELAQLRQSSEPTGPVRAAWEVERAQWTQERSKWEKDYSTWETQRKEMSEERENLLARLAELSDAAVRAEAARVKLSELEAEHVAWTEERDVVLNDMAQRSDELALLAKVREEYNQEQLKWEAERTSWAEEKAIWETEHAALQDKQETLLRSLDELTVPAESMKAAKVSAEKDRDFFREQYVQASAFVGSVRDENVELEKRVKIAEGQAQEGVAVIRALFEGRVKALQADVDRWKASTELLQEKDRRTNDELRRRAAQTPELMELCDHLNTENKSLENNVRRLSQAQQRSVHQRNKLFYEILLLKKERASLRSKLLKLAKTADSSTSNQETSRSAPVPPILDHPENMGPNDLEILPDPTPQSLDTTFDEPALFPCMWRPQWRDQCQQIFDTKEDLERHMQEHFRDLLAQ